MKVPIKKKTNSCLCERLFKVNKKHISVEFEIAGFSVSCGRKPRFENESDDDVAIIT